MVLDREIKNKKVLDKEIKQKGIRWRNKSVNGTR